MFFLVDEVTRSSHHQGMKQVMVSELKVMLSVYLADVRKGETIVVCDHKMPIARLISYAHGTDGLEIAEPSSSSQQRMRPRVVQLRKQVDVGQVTPRGTQSALIVSLDTSVVLQVLFEQAQPALTLQGSTEYRTGLHSHRSLRCRETYCPARCYCHNSLHRPRDRPR